MTLADIMLKLAVAGPVPLLTRGGIVLLNSSIEKGFSLQERRVSSGVDPPVP